MPVKCTLSFKLLKYNTKKKRTRIKSIPPGCQCGAPLSDSNDDQLPTLVLWPHAFMLWGWVLNTKGVRDGTLWCLMGIHIHLCNSLGISGAVSGLGGQVIFLFPSPSRSRWALDEKARSGLLPCIAVARQFKCFSKKRFACSVFNLFQVARRILSSKDLSSSGGFFVLFYKLFFGDF